MNVYMIFAYKDDGKITYNPMRPVPPLLWGKVRTRKIVIFIF